jgi:hypothetical protein
VCVSVVLSCELRTVCSELSVKCLSVWFRVYVH